MNTDYDLPSPPLVFFFSKEHNNKRKFEQMQGAQQEVEELEEELAQLQVKGKKTKPLAKDWSPTLKKKINSKQREEICYRAAELGSGHGHCSIGS